MKHETEEDVGEWVHLRIIRMIGYHTSHESCKEMPLFLPS
jgi:hypothetical protein